MQVSGIKTAIANNRQKTNNQQQVNSQPHFGMVADRLLEKCENKVRAEIPNSGTVLARLRSIAEEGVPFKRFKAELLSWRRPAGGNMIIKAHIVDTRKGRLVAGTEIKMKSVESLPEDFETIVRKTISLEKAKDAEKSRRKPKSQQTGK